MHISKLKIGILLGGSLIMVVFASNYMVGHTFWGNFPLFLILPLWFSLIFGLLIYSKSLFQNQSGIWLSLLSGILLGKAFVYDSPLLFIGFIPLLFLKSNLENRAIRPKLLVHGAYAFNAFMVWNICATYWVANAALIPGFVAILLNSFFIAIPWCASVVFERHFPKIMGFSLLFFWISFEWVHQSWEISWPWLS
ncbi:MAG: hypothetical protein WAT16_10525, partial [Saprospiraceae bacterium]